MIDIDDAAIELCRLRNLDPFEAIQVHSSPILDDISKVSMVLCTTTKLRYKIVIPEIIDFIHKMKVCKDNKLL